MNHKKLVLAVVAMVIAVSYLATNVIAGQKVTVGANVPASQRTGIDGIRHDAWDALVKKYVDQAGMVDYRSWKADAGDIHALDAYLAMLSGADLSRPTGREATLAYWINAYNAVTVKGMLREYPTTSIRNHTAKVLGYNIWDDLLLVVGDSTYSLNNMEHKILRKQGEPRIHFAIVCASIGCPRLLNEAYTAARLNDQLTANARYFFADRTKFFVDRAGGIHVSPILQWFAEDFGANSREQMQTIAAYLPDESSRLAATGGTAAVTYLDYDWGINDRTIAAAGGANRRQ